LRLGALAIGIIWAAAGLHAQSVRVYSEFRRIGPDGQVVAADRAGTPREIISPAVARGGVASYRIVVSAPPGEPYTLHLGFNPDNVIGAALYREIYERVGDAWIPEKLERVEAPLSSFLPEPLTGPPGQTAASYWVDLIVPAQAPVQRVRFEVQLNIDNRWIIYPLEVRVLPAVARGSAEVPVPLAPLEANSAATYMNMLDTLLCGKAFEKGGSPAESAARSFTLRNALQDLALARSIEQRDGWEKLKIGLLGALGVTEAKAWCESRPDNYNPEIALRIRDFLFRDAVN
jgi:hypothetical protein